jgi:hypothetical protein
MQTVPKFNDSRQRVTSGIGARFYRQRELPAACVQTLALRR